MGIREERGRDQIAPNMVRMLQMEATLVGLPAVAVVWDPPDAAGRKTRYFRHLPSALSFLVGCVISLGHFSRRRRFPLWNSLPNCCGNKYMKKCNVQTVCESVTVLQCHRDMENR